MKKSTLAVVVLALALGAWVYYREFKHPAPEKSSDESKPAFSFTAPDVTAIEIERQGLAMDFEKRDGNWLVTRPVQTNADQPTLEGLANTLAATRISRTFASPADRLGTYGLANPAVKLEIQLKNGAKHRVRLGDKDFSGISVYGMLDDSKDVALLPESLLVSTDKPLDDLRDRSVLGLASWQVASFALKNAASEITASKEGEVWQIAKPRAARADDGAVSALLSQVAAAKMTTIEAESAGDLAKYGLANPALSFRVKLSKGEERALLVGKKMGDGYFARDTSRPMVFRIGADLAKKLGEGFADLRDKSIVHFDAAQLSRIEIRNPNGTIVCVAGKEGKWLVEEPASSKGKEVQTWKVFDPLSSAKALEVLDAPPAAIVAKLAKPAVEVTLTDQSGKATKIAFSAPEGENVYARTGAAGAAVYKLPKQTLDDLSFKLDGILF
jgi:Domain of unknown function (DUF4340)